ncbi:unannotated protein [freshwater metagenome]|uniref:Unannotated protein n=1 Tax=freshwater metagenome TaxID=449393 RepID=A0A6J7GW24_9ZZZZ
MPQGAHGDVAALVPEALRQVAAALGVVDAVGDAGQEVGVVVAQVGQEGQGQALVGAFVGRPGVEAGADRGLGEQPAPVAGLVVVPAAGGGLQPRADRAGEGERRLGVAVPGLAHRRDHVERALRAELTAERAHDRLVVQPAGHPRVEVLDELAVALAAVERLGAVGDLGAQLDLDRVGRVGRHLEGHGPAAERALVAPVDHDRQVDARREPLGALAQVGDEAEHGRQLRHALIGAGRGVADGVGLRLRARGQVGDGGGRAPGCRDVDRDERHGGPDSSGGHRKRFGPRP